LYSKLRHQDFEILGFPSNQFGAQEPDSNEDIAGFCESSGVEFRIMDKINVNGHQTHDVYKFLKQKMGIPRIEWNFSTYFLVGRHGQLKAFSGVAPGELENEVGTAINGRMRGVY
jgi:glutathione peroxidase